VILHGTADVVLVRRDPPTVPKAGSARSASIPHDGDRPYSDLSVTPGSTVAARRAGA
jgi:hypothetical protein